MLLHIVNGKADFATMRHRSDHRKEIAPYSLEKNGTLVNSLDLLFHFLNVFPLLETSVGAVFVSTCTKDSAAHQFILISA